MGCQRSDRRACGQSGDDRDEPGYIGSADESLGCSPSAYTYNGITAGGGQIAVAKRGTCARVARGVFGQQAGAAAVILLNNGAGLPPFEGQITSNPDTGEVYTVTIPLLGANGSYATSGTASNKLLTQGNGTAGVIAAADITNANYKGFGSFSSGGPRIGDAFLKPDVTAPGVSVISTSSGSGNGSEILSGTSMASPHNAGAAALVRQADPSWSVADIKAAIVNTADPSLASSGVTPFRISRGGSGEIQPAKATKTDVVAYNSGPGSNFDVAVSFGFKELNSNFSKEGHIRLDNNGSSDAKFTIAATLPQGSPATITFEQSSVTVKAHKHADIEFKLKVPAATAGAANGSGLSFQEVAGLITFTPVSAASNHGVALSVPYYLVPRALSNVDAKVAPGTKLAPGMTATVNLTNKANAPLAGDADFYAWGLKDPNEKNDAKTAADVQSIGVQSFPWTATTQLMVFAVNTFEGWYSPSTQEFDIYVDVDNDGIDDYIVVGADQGAISTGSYNGRLGSFVFSTRSGGASINFFATAPTNSSIAELPVLSSQLCRAGEPCLNAASPRITYHAVSFDLNTGGSDVVNGMAKYNAWTPSISVGAFDTLAPGGSASESVSIDPTEWALTPALGSMIVTLDNENGDDKVNLLAAKN